MSEGSVIRPNNGEDIQDLADDLCSCVETLRAMGKLNEIDSRVRMVKIIERLPLYLQGSWRKEAVDMVEKTGNYPGIERQAEFLQKVAREINDPVFGMPHNRQKDPKTKNVYGKGRIKGSSFNVQASNGVAEGKSSSGSEMKMVSKNQRCHLCYADDHFLTSCAQFKEMKPEKRLEFVKENKLCFNCLKHGKHRARWCRIKNCCGVHGCSSKHSRLLHDALKSPEREKVTATAQVDKAEHVKADSCACGTSEAVSSKVALPIIPVRVRGCGQKDSMLTRTA